ncbi:MAG: pyridoxal-phosphate dependent enzyme [Azospirillaceae bacterium]
MSGSDARGDVPAAVSRALAAIDRVPLMAVRPTPIQTYPRLAGRIGRPLLVKRDDLSGLALGGNKARKLEFLMARALAEGCDSVLATGFVQSNNAVQTAAAARRCGLEPVLVLDGAPPAVASGNLILGDLLGARTLFTAGRPVAEVMAAEAARLRDAGHRPFVLPPGGSTALGILGFVEAAFELAGQLAGPDPRPDVLVMPTGTGGTQAGLVLGLAIAGIDLPVVGLSTGKTAAEMIPAMTALAAEAAALLDWPGTVAPDAWIVDERFYGDGYAKPGREDFEAMDAAARLDGLFVDPVYTGRALVGLATRVAEGSLPGAGPVLFWHTGGHAALFAFDRSGGSAGP